MFQDKREESVEMSEKEESVGDKCGDNVQFKCGGRELKNFEKKLKNLKLLGFV